MANYNNMHVVEFSLTASGTMASNQYKFVKLSPNAGYFVLSTGGSNPAPVGVLQNDPVNGDQGEIRVLGTTRVWFSGSTNIVNGDWIMCGSAGGAELVAGGGSGIQGYALEGMSAGSGYIDMMLQPFQTITHVDNSP